MATMLGALSMAKCGLVLSIAVVWLGSSGVAYATPQIEVQGGV